MSGEEALTALVDTVEQIRNRLAHALPGDLSSDRIGTDTTADLKPILAELNRLR